MSETMKRVPLALKEVDTCGDTLMVDLWYPQVEGEIKCIEVGLVDVRAADSLRITYDFERDGFVISQTSWTPGEGIMHEHDDWQEVAFVKAWGRQKPTHPDL